jgi:hypothetical protein
VSCPAIRRLSRRYTSTIFVDVIGDNASCARSACGSLRRSVPDDATLHPLCRAERRRHQLITVLEWKMTSGDFCSRAPFLPRPRSLFLRGIRIRTDTLAHNCGRGLFTLANGLPFLRLSHQRATAPDTLRTSQPLTVQGAICAGKASAINLTRREDIPQVGPPQ